MLSAVRDYFEALNSQFGEGWNRFWFEPRDPFTLCVLRIVVGLLALYNVASYTPDLAALFGSGGILPVQTVVTLESGLDPTAMQTGVAVAPWRFSYLDYLRTPTALYVGHALGLAVLAAFTAGFFTRASTIGALIVVLSYYHRAPLITTPLEPVLSFTLLYLCLAPAGAYLSIDRWLALRKAAQKTDLPASATAVVPTYLATLSTRLIQVHLTIVYFMMLLSTVSGDVWWDGSAIWWLIAGTESRIVDFTWLHASPYFVFLFTHALVLFELAFAVLVWNRLARPLLLALSVPIWIFMGLITGLLGFCLMLMAAGLAFVSPETMRAALARWTPGCCGVASARQDGAVQIERQTVGG